jgi:TRAP-type mannitol/chloroaromatic compound transport system permease small subunit
MLVVHKISYFIDSINKFLGSISAILVLALALLVFYDAGMRYLFQSGSIALQELEWHLFSAIFLLALGYTHKHQKHVRVDIFFENYPRKMKAIFEIVSNLFIVIPFSLAIIYFSWDFVSLSFAMGESSPSGGLCCRYVIKSFIVIGFLFLALQALSNAIKNIEKLRK